RFNGLRRGFPGAIKKGEDSLLEPRCSQIWITKFELGRKFSVGGAGNAVGFQIGNNVSFRHFLGVDGSIAQDEGAFTGLAQEVRKRRRIERQFPESPGSALNSFEIADIKYDYKARKHIGGCKRLLHRTFPEERLIDARVVHLVSMPNVIDGIECQPESLPTRDGRHRVMNVMRVGMRDR